MNTIITKSDVAEVLGLRNGWRLDQFAKLWQNEFLPFEKARAFVRKLGLKSQAEWYTYIGNEKPTNIPACPEKVYNDEWQGMGDWLGTGVIANGDREFLSFKKARAIARKLGLKNGSEWGVYSRNGRPTNIPSSPATVYDDWLSWGDWLGTGNVHEKNFLPFKKARAFARKLGLKSGAKWKVYRKPTNIPACPERVYDEWRGMGDWLGTGTIASRNRVFLPFKKARAYVRKLGLKSGAEWNDYRKPTNIPASPILVYGDEWRGLGDWLGTGTIANQNRVFLPFTKARAFVRKLGLRSREEWKVCRKPTNIPGDPGKMYKSEWRGWGDWLGTGTVANQNRVFLPFKKARAIARKLGLKSGAEWRAYRKPANIPSKPARVYDEWRGMGDWLGTGSSSFCVLG